MVNTESLKRLLFVLFALLVFFIVIYLILNTFFINPITFHAKLEDNLLNKGEVGRLNSEIRNLAFYGLRDVSVESYIVKLTDEGNIVNDSAENREVMDLYSVGGLTAKVVTYDFDTSDFEIGRYRVYSNLEYTGNYNMPVSHDWVSKDFRII